MSKKVALAALTAALAVAGSVSVPALADEESPRGEAADPADTLPRQNEENSGESFAVPPSGAEARDKISPKAALRAKKNTYDAGLNPSATAYQDHEAGFLSGSHLNIHLRNAFFRRDYKHAAASGFGRKPDWQQWAQGIELNYESGYGFGFIGADASLYGALRLDGTNPEGAGAGDQLLHMKNIKTDSPDYTKTYGRVGRLNGKVKLGDEKNKAVFRYGLIGVDTSLVADSESRLLPSSYRGGSGDASLDCFDDLRLYGFYLDRIANRAGNSYDRFISSTGRDIDNIQVYGAGYVIDAGPSEDFVYLNGEYGTAKDYVKQYFGQATYYAAFTERYNLLANVQYRQAREDGKLWDRSTGGFDDKAGNVNANVLGTLDGFKAALSWTRTRAKNSGATGVNSHQFNFNMAQNEYGKGTFWTARQISAFNYDKENAYQAMVGYDFATAGSPGLSMQLTHTYGNDINKAVGLKNEQETDLSVIYAFPQPALQGLSLQLDHAWYVSREVSGNEYGAAGKRMNDLRVYANYNLAVF